MEQYNQKVMDHFQNPQNMGEIEGADGVGKVGNPKCGDVMMITIKVGKRNKKQETRNKQISKKNKDSKLTTYNLPVRQAGLQPTTEFEEFIEDIKFKTLGCAAAIASSSVTTELAKGKTLDEAYKMTKDDINNALGKLPAPKYHCSILAEDGIKRAILDYKSRNDKFKI